jgi:hypothetical protein
MLHFVLATDLKTAVDLGDRCLKGLKRDVEAPLNELGTLLSILTGKGCYSWATTDITRMLVGCRQTLRRVQDASVVCEVSQKARCLRKEKVRHLLMILK